MNYNHFRVVVILLLGSLLVVYTNCGSPFSGPSELVFKSNVYGGGSEVSYKAFEETVYPITRSYCISCHTTQPPAHAADDVREAHDAVISTFKVNFANIPSSAMVKKLREGNHNCWGDCAENALEMEAAIEEWNDAIKDSGVEPTTPTTSALVTEESQTMEMEFNDPTNPLKSNSVKLNIEAAMLTPPMSLTRSGETSYISVPNTNMASLANNAANAGLAYFSFQVPAAGQYKIWALVQGENNNDNSFYVKVLDGNTVNGGIRTFDFASGSQFNWRQVPGNDFSLVSNKTYSLELRQREDGARLSGIIVTSDTNFDGQEIDDYFGVTMSFDLSSLTKVPGTTFLIDVIDYDAYSYKFSNPRVSTSTSNIYVKGVKLLVNNMFNPQHSTYTIVDKIVSPADGKLSQYSMIVLKDKGLKGDHIKMSFDQLLVTSGGATNAGANGGATGGGTGTQTSLVAFQATVYPVSRSSAYSCVGCHQNVSPRHASDNTLTAHDSALSVVDFNNPANSRIVRKMRDERHNCQAFCDDIASQYENAIIEWRNRRQ